MTTSVRYENRRGKAGQRKTSSVNKGELGSRKVSYETDVGFLLLTFSYSILLSLITLTAILNWYLFPQTWKSGKKNRLIIELEFRKKKDGRNDTELFARRAKYAIKWPPYETYQNFKIISNNIFSVKVV